MKPSSFVLSSFRVFVMVFAFKLLCLDSAFAFWLRDNSRMVQLQRTTDNGLPATSYRQQARGVQRYG